MCTTQRFKYIQNAIVCSERVLVTSNALILMLLVRSGRYERGEPKYFPYSNFPYSYVFSLYPTGGEEDTRSQKCNQFTIWDPKHRFKSMIDGI